MNRTLQEALSPLCRDGLQKQAPLAAYTTFRIGGPADYLAVIDERAHLIAALKLLHRHQTHFVLLAGGSNVLISDAGVPGLTLIQHCKTILWPAPAPATPHLVVDAGASLASLARESIRRGLAGLSWAVSIPGSVGGAIVGNAGAHGHDIASVLHSVQVWHQGQIEIWPAADLNLTYRSSRLKHQSQTIILSATLQLQIDHRQQARVEANAALQHRRRTQPTGKSAGSIFKNPPGDYAGRLIEQAGLKGHCIGDACISTKHANFIINRGQATAAEVHSLITLAQNRVFEKFGVPLDLEILLLGHF